MVQMKSVWAQGLGAGRCRVSPAVGDAVGAAEPDLSVLSANCVPVLCCADSGGSGSGSARGVSARLSGRLRPADTAAGTAVRAADRSSSDRVDTGPRGQAGDQPFDEPERNPFSEPDNPFEEPEKNPFDEPEKNPFDEPEKNPFDEPEKNPFDEPEKNPFDEPEINPFDEQEKNPFDESEKNPFEEAGSNPFDAPNELYEVEVIDDAKLPKEKTRKRDKIGKMFRGLKSKKDDGAGDSADKKQKKASQGKFDRYFDYARIFCFSSDSLTPLYARGNARASQDRRLLLQRLFG